MTDMDAGLPARPSPARSGWSVFPGARRSRCGAPRPRPGLLTNIKNVIHFVAATPDGRILLPGQAAESDSDLNSHPNVIPVDARDGSVGQEVMINAPHGIPGQVGYYGSPVALPTPGGVVLAIAGSPTAEPTGQANYLLVGLR